MRRILYNWQVHGLPRCHAWYDDHYCGGLIWPWQRMGGDGEHAQHWDCMERDRADFERRMEADTKQWAAARGEVLDS